jgi:hypothetical protein
MRENGQDLDKILKVLAVKRDITSPFCLVDDRKNWRSRLAIAVKQV